MKISLSNWKHCFLMMLFAASESLCAQTITVNNMTEKAVGNGVSEYTLSKRDPHLVYAYSEPMQTDGKFVELKLDINWLSKKKNDSIVEIFWSSGSEGFELKNSLRSPITEANSIIQIPVDRLQKTIGALRIDFEKCDCRIKMSEPKWLNYDDVEAPTHLVDLSNYLDLKNGKDIALDKWIGMQLKARSPGVFVNSGYDPRILNTENLELPLGYAAGVYFEFDFDFDNEVQKFQLFWLLKNSRWSPRKSAYFALLRPSGAASGRKIFLPFDQLYSQKQLQHLRLDVPYCTTCLFVLKRARIVGWGEVQNYQQYKPERLYYVNSERPPKSVVAREFLQKAKHDIWFNLFFLTCLLFVLIATILLIIRR